ncbi:hypothetical protein XH87_13120 [Bradyrhizobium sp. CCBAU 53415]|nr:hypothetical protein [Bradyrhizobium sp. CCBAU 53415]
MTNARMPLSRGALMFDTATTALSRAALENVSRREIRACACVASKVLDATTGGEALTKLMLAEMPSRIRHRSGVDRLR